MFKIILEVHSLLLLKFLLVYFIFREIFKKILIIKYKNVIR